jgi:hypothetical protein
MLSAERFERIFGCPLTVEGHPRTLSGPSPDRGLAVALHLLLLWRHGADGHGQAGHEKGGVEHVRAVY